MANNRQAIKAHLEAAFQEYRRACYGDAPLPPKQYKEVRQAFLSGIHWTNGQILDPEDTTKVLREMLDVPARKDPMGPVRAAPREGPIYNPNNPEGEPTRHFTGRCRKCGSDDLWDDNLAYGCNKCGAILSSG